MKIRMMTMVAVAVAGLALGADRAAGDDQPAPAASKMAGVATPVYVCTHCDVLSLKAGKCSKCEMELEARHLLGVKDGQALTCACGADCQCDAAGMKDGKCACGKDVAKFGVKGKYVCARGCPVIAMKAGQCKCGQKLSLVE